MSLDESVQVAANLVEMGLDGVEVSGGLPWSGELQPIRMDIDKPENEAYFRSRTAAYKKRLSAPVILVGGLRSPQVIDDVLEKGEADLVAISRPLVREPDLVNRWADGDMAPASCVSCNRCFFAAASGKGIFCVQKSNADMGVHPRK